MNKRGVATDRISFLPDSLLCQILSNLPTKEAFKTSVLSKRWESVWLWVPLLDLDIYEFPGYYAFMSFVNGFLDISRESCIHKLKLVSVRDRHDPSYMTQWIHNAVMRKVRHLDVLCRWSYLVKELMPLSLYTCETLVYLKLQSVSLPDFEYVSLPHLKNMHLEDIIYSNDALLEKLISSCPVLEDLTVVRDANEEYALKALCVRSQSLKRLVLVLNGDEYGDSDDWEVVIDVPGLNYLRLKDDHTRSFLISNLSSSAKVDIDVSFYFLITAIDSSKRRLVREFFTSLSSVRDMTISGKTLKIICDFLKHEPLPQFPFMTRLYAFFCNSDLEKLPNFLESCPNLKHLVLELEEFKNNELVILSSLVPKCLRSSLEYVEMKAPISGARAEIKLVEYFLENSAVLNKFKMCLCCERMTEGSIIFIELMRLRRCSASCEVVVKLEGTYQPKLHRFL